MFDVIANFLINSMALFTFRFTSSLLILNKSIHQARTFAEQTKKLLALPHSLILLIFFHLTIKCSFHLKTNDRFVLGKHVATRSNCLEAKSYNEIFDCQEHFIDLAKMCTESSNFFGETQYIGQVYNASSEVFMQAV